MKNLGYTVNSQPGLTTETADWERRISQAYRDLHLATTQLHSTLSADSVAAVLLHAVSLTHAVAGLVNNIGVGDRAGIALSMLQDALAHNDPPPNLLPLVLDKGVKWPPV